MNINTYEDASTDLGMELDEDTDLIFDTGIAGFEIAYGSKNKEMIKKNLKKSARQPYQTRQKLDSIREKRIFEKENNPFSDYLDS